MSMAHSCMALSSMADSSMTSVGMTHTHDKMPVLLDTSASHSLGMDHLGSMDHKNLDPLDHKQSMDRGLDHEHQQQASPQPVDLISQEVKAENVSDPDESGDAVQDLGYASADHLADFDADIEATSPSNCPDEVFLTDNQDNVFGNGQFRTCEDKCDGQLLERGNLQDKKSINSINLEDNDTLKDNYQSQHGQSQDKSNQLQDDYRSIEDTSNLPTDNSASLDHQLNPVNIRDKFEGLKKSQYSTLDINMNGNMVISIPVSFTDFDDVHISSESNEDKKDVCLNGVNGAIGQCVENNFRMDHNCNFQEDLVSSHKTLRNSCFDLEEDLTRRSSESSVHDSLYNSQTSETNSLTFFSPVLHEVFVSVYQEVRVPHLGRTRVTVDLGSDSEEQTDEGLALIQESTSGLENSLQSSKVFFRAGGLAQLDDTRDEKITGTIVGLQAFCRGYLGRQKLKKLKVQHMAVTCIQRNVRKFMAIRNWPWWRLYTKLQPVLNVHRTEEELRVRDAELDHVKMELEKLEKERNEYKLSVEKLETKLSEVSADLAAEHTASSQAAELLDGETGQRLKLQKELGDIQSKFQNLQRKHEATELDLMHTRLLAASVDSEYDEEDGEGDSIYREKFERAKRELDFMKKKLQQQREEDQEQYDSSKKLLERKLGEVMAEDEEHLRQVGNLKKKTQRLNADMQDIKLHLEEQISRNSELEKKQRKFDNELQKVNNLLREEKAQREKLQRERDELAAVNFTVEQEVKSAKLDNEFQSEKVARLERDLQDLTSSEGTDDKLLLNLKRLKTELEGKCQEQEEELDDQAGTIQQLEQAKLKLEMEAEKMRQQHLRDMEEKETEVEEMRAATQKKVRHLETQIEEEYEEKQKAAKDKRELERKLKAMSEIEPISNRDTEKRLRRDLRRTRALLRDAQMMLDRQKEGQGSRLVVRQLRNQLEDAEFATAAAVKARKGFEMEVSDVQQQLDDITRAKQECEDRIMALGREKNDLQTKLEENEEDAADILKKYKAVVQQQSVDAITLIDQSKQIEELMQEKEQLKEQIVSLQSTLAYLQSSTVDKQALLRLEIKIRDLESRLDLEQTSKHRAEVQLSRTKEQLDKVGDEKSKVVESSMQMQEEMKRHQRQMRDTKEELAESQRREAEFSQRKHDLEKKVESLEIDFEQSQNDLRLALKRVTDLQAVIEDDLDSDDIDSDYSGAEDLDSEEESDGAGDSYLVSRNHSAYRGINSTDTLDLSHGPNGDIVNHSISEDR